MAKQEEEIQCSDCLAEAATNFETGELEIDGWDMEAEFGPRCPECVNLNAAPSTGAGIAGVAEALAVKEKI